MKYSVVHGPHYRKRAPLASEVTEGDDTRPPRVVKRLREKMIQLGDGVYATAKGKLVPFTSTISGAFYDAAVLNADTVAALDVLDEEIERLQALVQKAREFQRLLIERAIETGTARKLTLKDCVVG